jgi:hypothetical protein
MMEGCNFRENLRLHYPKSNLPLKHRLLVVFVLFFMYSILEFLYWMGRRQSYGVNLSLIILAVITG